jgi:hypothetical protein
VSQVVVWRMPRKRSPPARLAGATEDRFDPAAQRQVRMSDNAGADSCLTVDRAGARRPQRRWRASTSPTGRSSTGAGRGASSAPRRTQFRDDVVAAVGVSEQVVKQIAPSLDPNVVVRIDDRQVHVRGSAPCADQPTCRTGEIVGSEGCALGEEMARPLLICCPRAMPGQFAHWVFGACTRFTGSFRL